MLIPTPHNEAKQGDIAKTVIMPGDPLRAKYIADNYLTDVVCYNNVRGTLGFTGYYNGTRVSVQASGMGIPSMGIYSKELFEGYDVDQIIRVGSAGTVANKEASKLSNSVELRDLIVSEYADTDSNYLFALNIEDKVTPEPSPMLLELVKKVADRENIEIKVGKTFTSDIFYQDKEELIKLSKQDVMGVEMETLSLYANAKVAGKNALSMFTITDNIIEDKHLLSKERQEELTTMINLALELAVECEEGRN